MARVRVAKTLTEDVHGQLRADILEGRLLPGEPLRMEQLTAALLVSRSVLREALSRLVEQGLVTLQPQAGFRVKELSRQDLLDLTEARVHIEGFALEQAVQHGSLEWEQRVVGAHHVLSRTPIGTDESPSARSEWIRAHAAYHAALISGCPNARLVGLAGDLRDACELYRQWSAAPGRAAGRDVAAEHQQILDAALSRDPAAAVSALANHIERTTQLALSAIPPDARTE